MTNREAHEQAAGMGLEESFFRVSGIDPEAEYGEPSTTATNFPIALERTYIYTMIHHREMQPYEYCYALEVELARVRLVLRKMVAAGIVEAEEGLRIGNAG